MDSQHQELIGLVNQMYRIITNEEGNHTLEAILHKMSSYAKKHLKDEEALLLSHNYPTFHEHEADHAAYKEKVEVLFSELAADRQEVAKELYIFLRSWWLNHIVVKDKEYGLFLKGKGVQ